MALRDKDVAREAKRLTGLGWRFVTSAKGHTRVYDPSGAYAGPLSSSPGTPRWELARLRSMVRRYDSLQKGPQP